MTTIKTKSNKSLIHLAIMLSFITIFYNIGEGIISLLFGYADETISLFGFSVDSFVEVLSGADILHMLLRFKKNSEEKRDGFEQAKSDKVCCCGTDITCKK